MKQTKIADLQVSKYGSLLHKSHVMNEKFSIGSSHKKGYELLNFLSIFALIE